MNSDGLMRKHRELMKDSAITTKGCYFPKCKNNPIKAHSISNNKLLRGISEKGIVLRVDWTPEEGCHLTKCGRGLASTFKGFCDEHDKIFENIDTKDYTVGDIKQEFLFAMRGAAKELNAKETASASTNAILSGNNRQGLCVIEELEDEMKVFNIGQCISIRDQNETKSILIDTLSKKKYHVLESARFVLDGYYPIVASSSFNMELDNDGNIINNVFPEAYSEKMKPCFFTLFPQGDKTFCIISYFRKHRRDYQFLKSLEDAKDTDKKVLISNILASYVENFFIKPSYWESLNYKTKKQLRYLLNKTILREASQRFVALIEDAEFNIFQ